MKRSAVCSLVFGVIGVSSATPASAAIEKDPATLAKGKVYEWKSEDGLAYHYRIPSNYDKAAGANLTFILHGSNLDRTWGFANHKPTTFRPDDIVVCPDGTTPNGRRGFYFIGKDNDVDRLHALHVELKKAFNVTATYLYGHSQGSFFALHYAGAKPEHVQGVVAHASGVWTWTRQPATARHQAIVFMHGTQDPVVPYGQSVGGYESFVKNKHPTVRLRSLEGWNHWPAEHNGPTPHASQQLAWVEGMTSNELKRQAAAFKTLSAAKSKAQHDFAALYLLASRIADTPNISAGAERASAKAIKSVEDLVDKHIAALAKADPQGVLEPSGASWIGHLPMFLRAFAGVPKADALNQTWSKVLKQHQDASTKDLRAYYTALKSGDKPKAFSSGVKALKSCFLTTHCADRKFLDNMKAWSDDARKLKLDADEAREFKTLHKNYIKALQDGKKGFEAINRKASL